MEEVTALHLVIYMKYTDDQLLTRVETNARGFEGWKPGCYDIWVRETDPNAPFDQFNDKVYTFFCEKYGVRPKFIMVCTGTSIAGSFGLFKFRTYNPLGCAVLQSDRIVYWSHEEGLHKGKPAYVEVRGFPYYRDGNMNKRAEEIGQVYTDVIRANCHRAGKHSTIIYNWSVACLVRNDEAEFLKWFNWMNGRPLNVCILKRF